MTITPQRIPTAQEAMALLRTVTRERAAAPEQIDYQFQIAHAAASELCDVRACIGTPNEAPDDRDACWLLWHEGQDALTRARAQIEACATATT